MYDLEILDEVLVHVGQLCKTSRTAHNVTSVTTVTTCDCYAYSGTYDKVNGARISEPFDWSVLLPPTVKAAVDVGDTIRNVVDSDGIVIITVGVIRKLDRYDHWEGGTQVLVAGVSRT